MAPVKAAKAEVSDKKRVSKSAKRKAKQAVEAPAADEEEEEPTIEAGAKAAPSAKSADGADAGAEPEESKPRKTKARRLEEMQAKADEEPAEPRGVMYIGHIPDGFFEPQMRKFFTQFGKVTRLRISRSKKNAKSKGYGFVEFEEEGVAKIVAETMHKYLLFGKTLVCHLIPKEQQHPMLFKGCKRGMRNMTNLRWKKFKATYNERPTVEVDGEKLPQHTTRQARRRSDSNKKLKSVLANLGVEYDVDAVNDGAAEPAEAPAKAAKVEAPAEAAAGAAAAEPNGPAKKKRKKVAA